MKENSRPILRWKSERRFLGKKEQIELQNKVFVTGHMPDKVDAAVARYPNTMEDTLVIREQLHATLNQIYERQGVSELVLCSGSAGTDLLAVEWALQKEQETGRKISFALFLPYNKDFFRSWAVAYGDQPMGEYWGQLFDLVSDSVHEPQLRAFRHRIRSSAKRLVGSNSSPDRDQVIAESKRRNNGAASQHYADVNTHITQMLRPSDFVVAVWDGRQGRKAGGTRDALIEAAGRIADDSHLYILQPQRDGRGLQSVAVPPSFEELKAAYDQRHTVT